MFPTPKTENEMTIVENGKAWLDRVTALCKSNGIDVPEPHIVVTPRDGVVFEWWNKERKLTFYVSDDYVDILKVWGPNMETEMENFQISSDVQYVVLFQWLMEV